MKRRFVAPSGYTILVAVFCFALLSGCDSEHSGSSSGNWEAAMVRGTDHLDHGRWEQAESELLAANNLASSQSEKWETLDRLGALFDSTERKSEAKAAWRRALIVAMRVYGKDHVNVATALNNVATIDLEEGRLEEAEKKFRRVLSIYEGEYGLSHAHTAAATQNLAAIYYRRGEYRTAASLFGRVVRALESEHGSESIELEPALSWLAMLKYENGDYAAAESLFRRSLRIHERQFGPNHLEVADPVASLADVFEATGQFEDANALHQRMLQIVEVAHGSDSTEFAAQLNLWALFLERVDRRTDAVEPYRKAIKILFQRPEETEASGITLDILAYNYGDCLMQLGQDRGSVTRTLLELGLDHEVVVEALRDVYEDAQEFE